MSAIAAPTSIGAPSSSSSSSSSPAAPPAASATSVNNTPSSSSSSSSPVAAPAGPVTLGGKTFSDSSELWNYTKALRDSLDRDATVTGTMLAVLLALLDRHPRAAEKKGSGVDSITFAEHPTYAGTQCFFINRTDGTTEDFSFRKCISAIFPNPPSSRKGKNKRGNSGPQGGARRQKWTSNAGGHRGSATKWGPGHGNNGNNNNNNNNDNKRVKRDHDGRKRPALDMSATGVCVAVEGLPKETHFHALKSAMSAHGKVTFVVKGRESTGAIVQFRSAYDAESASKRFVSMDGADVAARLMSVDEEQAFYARQREYLKNRDEPTRGAGGAGPPSKAAEKTEAAAATAAPAAAAASEQTSSAAAPTEAAKPAAAEATKE